jgi:hypothetical protein
MIPLNMMRNLRMGLEYVGFEQGVLLVPYGTDAQVHIMTFEQSHFLSYH